MGSPNSRPTGGPSTRPGSGGSSVRPIPSVGGGNRPQLNNPGNFRPANRPSLGDRDSRPNFVGNRPSLGNVTRPAPLPGVGGNRPGDNRPGTRPGGGDRPGAGGNRPGGGDRPGIGGNNRPGRPGGPGPVDPGRPGTRPQRPGGGDRPIIGGNRPNRPGNWNRPGGNNNNIIIGGGSHNRPGWNGRPDWDHRPGGNRPGWDHRPGWNHGPGWNHNHGWGNRPAWDRPSWNRPGWGWGGGGWQNNWRRYAINNRYHWYHGPWGYWGSGWYSPLAWGAAGWGLGAWTSTWGYGGGYGYGYYNPYYVTTAPTVYYPYDYSQPVVVNNYTLANDVDPGVASIPSQADTTSPGMQAFDQGLAAFKAADYSLALNQLNTALKEMPGDPVVHEVRALTLFALGDYQQAAAGLNSLLASAPGMDWTTASSLYGNPADYTTQLRRLEAFCKDHPNDPSAHFVLAYQYLVTGAQDAAVDALQVVVKNQPKDVVAKRMLDALAPPAAEAAAAPEPTTPLPAPSAVNSADAPETDLVGSWRARAGDTTIELTVSEDSQFVWKATPQGQPPIELKGDLSAEDDEVTLDSDSQGAMSGTVTSQGADKWRFNLSGAPANDPGLTFERVR
ncbi:tetratricopeptide repeat protein [Planctomicrobium sp. SH664]|uniref:tetratricopeptide repeat protein n=1 Tax=Planctomicrobium sp. SH664 TaxID=3448125 RepID=UPI003F5C4546